MNRAALALALLMTAGCGASALQRQATAASMTRVVLDGAASAIEIACADPDTGEKVHRCLAAVEGHEAARAAWDAWATALLLAVEDEGGALDFALGMMGPLLRVYSELVDLLAAVGVDAPPLPAFLEAL